ncbi:MAG: response regulator [bacterium]
MKKNKNLETVQAKTNHTEENISNMEGFSVLIAEDIQSVRETVVDLLEIKGFKVTSVTTGRHALEKLEKGVFDIVILDINMPEMNGIEVLRRVRNSDVNSIVIIITAYGSAETATEALKLGAFDYVTKPFSSDTLYKVVSNAVKRRKLEMENEFLRSTVSLFDNTHYIINSPEKIFSILKKITSYLLNASDSDETHIYLLDKRENRFALQESHARTTPVLSGRELDTKKIKLMIEEENNTLVHGNQTACFFRKTPGKLPESLMVIPLIHAGKITGFFIFLSFLENKRFMKEQQHPLEVFAGYFATVIENANLYRDMMSSFNQTIQGFVHAIEAKDTYTKGHSERVTMYSVATAQEMGMSSQQIEILYKGGRLHDIGKIGLHYEKLNKPGKLTEEEWEMFRKHPAIGKSILKPMEFLSQFVPVVYQHHERWDGGGYPSGLKGDEIQIEARIVAIADTYDAMTSDRPYRKALSHEIAFKEIEKCSGTQFDPEIVPFFIKAIEKYRLKCEKLGLDYPK